jgi:ATP-dependent helicase STH1/SNF2
LNRYTRRRSGIFLELPDRTDYADYYETIKEPISLDIILQRINSPFYSTWQECAQDFYLMFKNAMTYNEEGSLVYQDAIALQEILNSVVQQYQ